MNISGNFDVCPTGTLAELERLRDEVARLKLTLAHAAEALDKWGALDWSEFATESGNYVASVRQEIREALEWKHETQEVQGLS